jgi:hypothetical protein
MYLHVAIKSQRNSVRFEHFSAIFTVSLIEALKEKQRNRQGWTIATHDDSSSARNIVELCGGMIGGNYAVRTQCRRAFGHETWYCHPALFVTLTPNVDDSFFVMAHYTCISSVNARFGANQLPRLLTLHSADLHNDVASVHLFIHYMDAFTEACPPSK